VNEIALALGGGGVKGISHIGVIRRLENEGFQIRAVSGTSAGAIAGALFAAGYDTASMERFIREAQTRKLFASRGEGAPSLMGLAGLEEMLRDALGGRSFADLQIPFACAAVDLQNGQEIVLNNGSVLDAVMASVAIPGVFPPRTIAGITLVDGGMLDPVPVSIARWLAPTTPVVAVCLTPVPHGWSQIPEFKAPASSPIPAPIINQLARFRIGQAFQIFSRSVEISMLSLAELRMERDRPDVIIRPDLIKYNTLDLVDPDELIQLGEIAAVEHIPEILRALSLRNQIARIFTKSELPGKVLPSDSE
jgi:NTE family protein